jgi:hypothetical protein
MGSRRSCTSSAKIEHLVAACDVLEKRRGGPVKLIIAIITPFALLGADCRLTAPTPPEVAYEPDFVPIGSPECRRCGETARHCLDAGALPASFEYSADGRTCMMRCDSGIVHNTPMNGTDTACGYDITLRGRTVQNLCPLDHFEGDSEFDGHGPEITVEVGLSTRGNQVLADVDYQARETVPDRTSVRGEFSPLIAEHGGAFDRQVEIEQIISPGSFSMTTTTSGTGLHDLVEDDGRPVLHDLVVVGDTGDTDIPGNANRCDDDTHIVTMSFRPVRVRIRRVP